MPSPADRYVVTVLIAGRVRLRRVFLPGSRAAHDTARQIVCSEVAPAWLWETRDDRSTCLVSNDAARSVQTPEPPSPLFDLYSTLDDDHLSGPVHLETDSTGRLALEGESVVYDVLVLDPEGEWVPWRAPMLLDADGHASRLLLAEFVGPHALRCGGSVFQEEDGSVFVHQCLPHENGSPTAMRFIPVLGWRIYNPVIHHLADLYTVEICCNNHQQVFWSTPRHGNVIASNAVRAELSRSLCAAVHNDGTIKYEHSSCKDVWVRLTPLGTPVPAHVQTPAQHPDTVEPLAQDEVPPVMALGAELAARFIKRDLERMFPSSEFTVRASAGYDRGIYVFWRGGPGLKEVREVCSPWKKGGDSDTAMLMSVPGYALPQKVVSLVDRIDYARSGGPL